MSRYSALAHPDPDAQKSAVGLGAQLTQLYDTQAARSVLLAAALSQSVQRHVLDLHAPGLAYLGVDNTAHPDLALLVGSAVLAGTSALARTRLLSSQRSAPRFLVVTRAGAADYSHLVSLMAKARSGGISVVLSDQSPSDWPVDNWGQLFQNINVTVMMSQSSLRDAAFCTEFIGDSTATPSTIHQLGVGEAVVRVIRPESRTQWVSVSSYSRTSSSIAKSSVRGKVIVVASPIGGSGRTTLSYLLAAQLAKRVKRQGKRVCLLDADINRPGVHHFIDTYSPNITNLVKAGKNGLTPSLEEVIISRSNFGPDFLLGPAIPTEITSSPELYEPAFWNDLLLQLSSIYDYVVIDTPVAYTQHALMSGAFLPRADYLVVTAPLTYPGLLAVDSWTSDVFRSPGPGSAKVPGIGLVLNRYDDPAALTVAQATKEMGYTDIVGLVPVSAVWPTLEGSAQMGTALDSLEPDVVSALNAILDRAVRSSRKS